MLLAAPAVAFYGLPRYRVPLDPFLLMVAAVALKTAFERVARQ